VPQSIRVVAFNVADLRRALGWTQKELGRRADLSQSFISAVENARVGDLTFSSATRMLEAMGAKLTVGVTAPFLGDRELQRDSAHSRCTAYVASRLKRDGWQASTEVEIGGDRSRGWIDVLAYNPVSRQLVVIEVKTEIRDLGAIERTLGWYEREAWAAARRLGWRPRQVIGCLLLLATDANEARVADNRATLKTGFPIRATSLRQVVSEPMPAPPGLRAMALIDPRSRRRDWLRPSRIDGRRTPSPYVDYADFMRSIRPRR
jgi:transcriptional regulator with XRE-family HTH domain